MLELPPDPVFLFGSRTNKDGRRGHSGTDPNRQHVPVLMGVASAARVTVNQHTAWRRSCYVARFAALILFAHAPVAFAQELEPGLYLNPPTG